MATKHSDFTKRVTDAIDAVPPRERSHIFPEHDRAYRLAQMVNDGLVNVDGISDDGNAALDALGKVVKVEREPKTADAKAHKS